MNLRDYNIELDRCEAVNLEDLEKNEQLRCHWTSVPGDYESRASLTGIGTDAAGNKNCESDPPKGIYIDPNDVTQRTKADSPFHVRLNMDRDELNLSDTPNEVSVSWCVRIDLFEEIMDFSVTYHKTFITVTFKLDGSFAVDSIDVKENRDLDKASFNKEYKVTSYQCDLNEPHAATNMILTQKSNHLGICVDTVDEGSVIAKVDEFNVDMPAISLSLPGYTPLNNPRVLNGIIYYLSTFDCTLKKSPTSPHGTKCYMETIVETPFFDAWNYGSNDYKIRGFGAVELMIDSKSRKLANASFEITDSRGLQGGEESSYSVIARIGSVGSTKYTSGAEMRLFVYFAAVFGTISFLTMF